jgi:hypothetical protein
MLIPDPPDPDLDFLPIPVQRTKRHRIRIRNTATKNEVPVGVTDRFKSGTMRHQILNKFTLSCLSSSYWKYCERRGWKVVSSSSMCGTNSSMNVYTASCKKTRRQCSSQNKRNCNEPHTQMTNKQLRQNRTRIFIQYRSGCYPVF